MAKEKKLSAKLAESLIAKHNSQKIVQDRLQGLAYYQCGSDLIIHYFKPNEFIIFSETRFSDIVAEWEEMDRENRVVTYIDRQEDVKLIESNPLSLVKTLFDSVGMPLSENLLETDLALLDRKIKAYGSEKAFHTLFLNIEVFCGEYTKGYFGGKWLVIQGYSADGSSRLLKPKFVGRNGRAYDFLLGGCLAKMYYARKIFSLKTIIRDAITVSKIDFRVVK
jgi:hypothetical protein